MATKKRYSDKKCQEIVSFYLEHGEAKTLEAFNISSSTLNRTKSQFNKSGLNLSGTLQKIREIYTDKELHAIAEGGRIVPGQDRIPIIDFSGKCFRFAYFTDPHFGSIYFPKDAYYKMLEECKDVDAFFCTGDVCEGMSGRAGHIYDLTHLGVDNQVEFATEMLSNIDKPLYMISGNHDRWFIKAAGIDVVKTISERLDNAHYLGHDTGIVNLKKTNIQLWHGEDGNSYAISYRIQKVIEAIPGGTKPNIMLLGHTHKMGYFFLRNIHAISGGSICLQTAWMRGKRIEAHTGFWIIDVYLNNKGEVVSCSPTWYPFYM